MDFKSLINKIESIDGKVETPAAPQLPKTVQLDESASLRVLAGQTSYIAEAKKAKGAATINRVSAPEASPSHLLSHKLRREILKTGPASKPITEPTTFRTRSAEKR